MTMPSRVPTFRAGNLPRPAYPRPCDRTAKRMEAKRFYAGERWRTLRRMFLRAHPLCTRCSAEGVITQARDVHHKVKRAACPELAYEWDNLEALCRKCHSAETGEGR